MNAVLKEIKDTNGHVSVAVIWVTANHLNNNEMNDARNRLNIYISNYVGTRGYNMYMHTEWDTVSATLIFDINNIQGQNIKI